MPGMRCLACDRAAAPVQRLDSLDPGTDQFRHSRHSRSLQRLNALVSRSLLSSGGTLALDGGILLNQGIHLLDLLLYLCGPVREVFAVAERRLHDIEFADTISVTLRYVSGAAGSFEASIAYAPGSPKRLEISGTSGTVLLENEQVSACRIAGKHPVFPAPPCSAVMQDASSPVLASSELHRRQLAEFVKAIREDAPLSASGEEGLRVLELIEAIHLSADRHLPIFCSARNQKALPGSRTAG